MGKTTEYLRFSAPGGEKICFPAATVTGDSPGPKVVITAGIHGCEYPGIAAAIALFKNLDEKKVHGCITIVTITNVAAFEARTPFVCPVDGKNPNRFFPGTLTGTYTDALTYHVLHDILKGADYYLDLHGGDLVEALEPFSICHTGASPEVDQKSLELALYYGLPNLVKTTWNGEWPDSGTTYANASERGIPSIIAEAGGIGQMDPASIDLHMQGLLNVLRYTGTLDGTPEKPKVTLYAGFHWVYTPWKGMFYCRVKVGECVKKGQLLGTMEDYFGNRLGDILSETDGKIVFLETTPAIAENGLVLGIAYS